ncbi:Lsr2 dimerization domain-containing protein [Nocardioides flavescens]|uniref:Lsr2 family protein n=1 Tax=Nocardioides flavescens TaxID=2691959 RepID=A0A6L7EW50_9ACTN|nr:Lsr2 family protein [Nocardioides flavescens]
MAQRVITQLVDDITGEDIADGKGETVTYSLDGQQYSIDLTTKNADKFRGLFQDYIAVSQKQGRKSSTRSSSRTQAAATDGPSAKDLRDWAKSNGLDVPERGRIPQAVRDAFDSAN